MISHTLIADLPWGAVIIIAALAVILGLIAWTVEQPEWPADWPERWKDNDFEDDAP